jgi:hypothetical protein
MARLLYDDGASRPYGDSDILVPRSRLKEAEAILGGLGFERLVESDDVPSGMSFHHASPWGRQRDFVDLHWTLPGAGADPEWVWEALAAHTRPDRIGGADASVPNAPATGLVAALHLASHGSAAGKALADLERSLERVAQPDWERAAAIAAHIEALETFAAGLRMCDAGAKLADELGLAGSSSVHLAIAAAGSPGTAHGIQALAAAPGWGVRARILARALVPTRRYMRMWFPRAVRGPGWLAFGYLYRPLWLARRAAPSLVAWGRARRKARSVRAPDGN